MVCANLVDSSLKVHRRITQIEPDKSDLFSQKVWLFLKTETVGLNIHRENLHCSGFLCNYIAKM